MYLFKDILTCSLFSSSVFSFSGCEVCLDRDSSPLGFFDRLGAISSSTVGGVTGLDTGANVVNSAIEDARAVWEYLRAVLLPGLFFIIWCPERVS